jgi:sortase B
MLCQNEPCFQWTKLNLQKVLFLLCLGLILFSSVKIGHRIYSLARENREYEALRKLKQDNTPAESAQEGLLPPVTSDTGQEVGPYKVIIEASSRLNSDGILKMYAENREINEDMVGWLQMPGYEKNIDYPVMQAQDNSFYLTNDFFKNKAYCGSIFMDTVNNPNTVDRNIVLYGHAMKELGMFGNLMDFPDKPEEYLDNTKIYLDLMNTQLEYEVFSAYYTEVSFNYRQTAFATDDEYQSFLNAICSKSFYDYGIIPGTRDRILTLSTCNNYAGKDDRTVIHARLVRQTLFTGIPDPAVEEEMGNSSPKEVVSANIYLRNAKLQYSETSPGTAYKNAPFDIPFKTSYRYYNALLPLQAKTCRLLLDTCDPMAVIEASLGEKTIDPGNFSIPDGIHVIKVIITSQDQKYSRTYSISVDKGDGESWNPVHGNNAKDPYSGSLNCTLLAFHRRQCY